MITLPFWWRVFSAPSSALSGPWPWAFLAPVFTAAAGVSLVLCCGRRTI